MSGDHIWGGELGGERAHIAEVSGKLSTPNLGKWKIYPKSDGWFIQDAQGNESRLAFASAKDMYVQDDFVSGSLATGEIGQLGWNRGGGVGVVYLPAEVGHPGIIQITATATLSFLDISDVGVGVIHPDDNFTLLAITRNNGNFTDQLRRGGLLSDSSANPPSDGIYFEFDTGNGDTTFQSVTRSGGVQTKKDTGIIPSLNVFAETQIRRNGTSIEFVAAGTVLTTHISVENIPSVPLSVVQQGRRLGGGGNPQIDIDFVSIHIPGLGR